MIFYHSYCIEYSRVLSGIILESRQIISGTKNKGGFEVEAYVNSEIEKVTDNVIPYKLETVDGNLVAYFSLLVGDITSQYQLFIRPAFLKMTAEINLFIANFITSNDWDTDILQGELKTED